MPGEKPGNKDLQAIADIDRNIHAPARLMILAYLSAVGSADFTFLLNQTGLTRGNLSSHLGKLEEVGYIAVKREFVEKTPRSLIRISKEGQAALESYRENMKDVLNKLLG